MIKRVIIFHIILIAGLLSLNAQDQLRIPAGITLSLKTGNSAELSKYFNSTVQVLLLGKEDFYKKNVAETILHDFFMQHKPADFVIRHQGQGGTTDAQYAIGNLKTDKGEFRVYFLLKKVGQDLLIHQIRIEPDDGKK
ncbi:MAG: DUF4783 domain-containing protein [Bacteroidales bacterium]